MRYSILIFGFTIIASLNIHAQSWAGYETGNFAGLHGLQFQPADLVSSPYRMDINVLSVNATLFGSSVIPKYNIFNGSSGSYISNIKELLKLETTRYALKTNLMLPSVSYSINEKSSIALTTGIRAFGVGRVSELRLQEIFQDAVSEDLANKEYNNEFGRFNAFGWSEFALTYSRIMYSSETGLLKAGATAKLLQGLGELTYEFGNTNIKLDGTSALEYFDIDFGYRYNDQVDQLVEEEGFELFGSSGFGLDLGLSYERLLNDESDTYPGYKYKVGVAMIDAGHILYDAAKRNNFSISAENVSLDQFNGINTLDQFVDTLESIFDVQTTENPGSYKVKLPTRVSAMVDYNMGNNIFFNLTQQLTYLNRNFNTAENKPSYRVAFTPRFETKNYGLYLPLQYGKNIDFNTGISLRWKGLIVGSGNIISRWFYESNSVVGDVYFIGKFPLLHKEYKKKKEN